MYDKHGLCTCMFIKYYCIIEYGHKLRYSVPTIQYTCFLSIYPWIYFTGRVRNWGGEGGKSVIFPSHGYKHSTQTFTATLPWSSKKTLLEKPHLEHINKSSHLPLRSLAGENWLFGEMLYLV